MNMSTNTASFPYVARPSLLRRIHSTLGCRGFPIVTLHESPGSGLREFVSRELCQPDVWDEANCLVVGGESFLADAHVRALRGELPEPPDGAFFDAQDLVRVRSVLDAVVAGARRDEHGWFLAIANMQALGDATHREVVRTLVHATSDPDCQLVAALCYSSPEPAKSALAPRMEPLVGHAAALLVPLHDHTYLEARALLFEDRCRQALDLHALSLAYQELGRSAEAFDALLLHMLDAGSVDVEACLPGFVEQWRGMKALERHLLRHIVHHAPVELFSRSFALALSTELNSAYSPDDVMAAIRRLTRSGIVSDGNGGGHFVLSDPAFSLHLRQSAA